MLTNLHVKNLALIDEAEVEFGPGLNILTGETGAGKSILIGSINAALGKKISREMIRTGETSALVELVFETENPHVLELLKEQGLGPTAVAADAYAVVPQVENVAQAVHTLQQLRKHGVRVQMHSPANSAEGMGSIKSQFKRADASGAAFALVFGPDELARECIMVKSLRDGAGEQVERPLAKLSEWATTLQSQR